MTGRCSSVPASIRPTSSARSRRSTHEVRHARRRRSDRPRGGRDARSTSSGRFRGCSRPTTSIAAFLPDRRALRPRPRLRPAPAGAAPGGHARRHPRRRADVLDPGAPRRSPVAGPRSTSLTAMTKAVFFDVDFTLIHPGPTFQGVRLPRVLRAARHRRSTRRRSTRGGGRVADARRRRAACTTRRSSSPTPAGSSRAWAAPATALDAAARDIYDEWSACGHFTLYEEVPDVLRGVHARGTEDRA